MQKSREWEETTTTQICSVCHAMSVVVVLKSVWWVIASSKKMLSSTCAGIMISW